MQITLKSFNIEIISLFLETRIKPILKKLGLSFSVISLPTVKKIYTMNKSPHVFSKSKESFEFKTFSKLIIISSKNSSKIELFKFERLINKNIVNGLNITFKV